MTELPGITEESLVEPAPGFNPLHIGERLMAFIALLGFSRKKMAQELNVKTAVFQDIAKGQIDDDTFIPIIILLDDEYGLSINWLITGNGVAFGKKAPKTPGAVYQFLQQLRDPKSAGLILSALTDPLIKPAVLAKVLKLTNFFKEESNASQETKLY
jgi:hypothetical protein